MTVKAIDTAAIEKETGRSWADWRALLDRGGAAALPHGKIVEMAKAAGCSSGWWAQGVAVAYEQAIGRRKPGQRADGTFSASVTRAVPRPPKEAFAAWRKLAATYKDFAGETPREPPTTSETPKRLYWRCKFADGSSAVLAFEPKPGGKTLAALEHQGLKREVQVDTVKTFWRAALEQLEEKKS
jgi:peptidoglycan hydrolase-like protein with peptidoglycan-binding domain